jgi:hypothetical protein
MTPTWRGFDTFLGTWHCCTHYYNHTFFGDGTVPHPVLDMTRSQKRGDPSFASFDLDGQYSTELYANESVRVIRTHNRQRGLYLYLAFQAVHGPYMVPKKYSSRYSRRSPDEYVYEGMVTAVDAAVGRVVSALRGARMWDATLLLVHSDNGGSIGRNGAMRGGKFGLWEGGVRITAFLGGPLVNAPDGRLGRSWHGLGHVADLLPTLLGAAGQTMPNSDYDGIGHTGLDGKMLWTAIMSNATSPRTEVIHQVVNQHNPRDCHGADHDAQNCGGGLRTGRWKLLVGYPGDSRTRNATNLHSTYAKWELISRYGGQNASQMPRLDGCHIFSGEGCACWRSVCLFDVEVDQNEQHDQSVAQPGVVAKMLQRLRAVSSSAPTRAGKCGRARRGDEQARKEAVGRHGAYLPYALDAAWENDPNLPQCAAGAVGEATWWYDGQPELPAQESALSSKVTHVLHAGRSHSVLSSGRQRDGKRRGDA